MPCSSPQSFLRIWWGSSTLREHGIPEKSWAAPHHRVTLAEIGPKEMSTNSLDHYTKAKHVRATDGILKGSFMLPRQIMLVPRTECWNVALCYKNKSCLFRGQTIRNWLCGTKPNHIFAVDGMLKVSFADQTKSCLSCGQNVRSWICDTKPNHVCAMERMLEVGLVVPSQIIFVSRMEC